MTFLEFFIMIGIFIALMILFKRADKWVKKLQPKTVKTINWIGFIVGLAGGVLWYAYDHNLFMFMTLIGIVTYFLFYSYDSMEEEGQK
ncbi:MAG: hypothetical protein HYS21_01160 [Deltaproteobacteria bacterium]|nr:hypothetical protein [Deltaproteobacteria bacterium]